MNIRAIPPGTIVLFLLCLPAFSKPGDPTSVDRNERATTDSLLDMSIEELMDVSIDTVYGASKYVQKLSEAPASVTVISADEIRKYGYRTLAEVLRSVAGFYINYDRNYHYVGVRGFRRPGDYDTRILLLLDGHRLNENVGDSPPLGMQLPLDLDLIEKVEVIRGPGSSLYGSNALLAVVNVVTKGGRAVDGVELSGGVGSFDTQRGRVTYGKVLDNNLDLLLSATTYCSDGPTLYFSEFDTPETSHGVVDNDDEQANNFVARASWGDLSLLLAHTSREKGIPTAPWDTVFGDPRTRTWDDTTLAGLTYTRTLSEQYSLRGRVAYGQYDYDGGYVYDYAEPGEDPYVVLNHDYWKGRWWEGEIQATAKPVENHTIIAGAEFRYNARQAQGNYDEEVYLDHSTHGHNWGVYLQDEFTPLERLTFVAGVRHDEYDTFGGTTNPRLALIHQVLQETTLKLLYGKAFRAPNVYELHYHDGGYSQKAPLHLHPETIETYEVVVEQQLGAKLRASLSGFYYVMDDLIDQYLDPADGLLVFTNRSAVEAEGVELALHGRWDGGLRSRVSYTYVEAEDESTDESLVNSPKHLAKLNVIAPVVPERLFAGLEVLYDSKAETLAGDYADDFTLTNLTLTYVGASKRLEISAGLYNLFDVDYAYPGFGEHAQDVIAQDGRTFRTMLTYRF